MFDKALMRGNVPSQILIKKVEEIKDNYFDPSRELYVQVKPEVEAITIAKIEDFIRQM
jgi:hypothetical protein